MSCNKVISCLLILLAVFINPLLSHAGRIQLNGGGEMYYEEHGKGVPVILLHGHTLDRRMWDEQVKVLRDKYYVVVPDLRGYGISSDPIEDFQFTHMDDVVALMDSLGIEKAHVVGLSMGGFIAGDMLAMCPERLLSCVMVSGETVYYQGPSKPRTEKEKEKFRVSGAKVRRNLAAYKRSRVASLKSVCYVWNEFVEKTCTEEVMDWNCWQAMNVPARIYYGSDALKELRARKPEVPSLIIYGDKERTTDSSLLKYLPNGRQIIFKKCGHMVNLEYPELFNSTLLQWLEEVENGINK